MISSLSPATTLHAEAVIPATRQTGTSRRACVCVRDMGEKRRLIAGAGVKRDGGAPRAFPNASTSANLAAFSLEHVLGASPEMSSVQATGSAPRLALGDLVAGKYRVERILGEGGMGVVVAARHEELGQKVAIKVLRPELAGFEGALERFLREARAAARLESDHVARVFDVGKLGDDCAFMVMECLEGQDLEKLLAARGRLDVEEAIDYVLEALEAVAHAHAAGMVHRDLKPSNLFLAEKAGGARRIKVLDFGISKAETGLGTGSQQSSTLTSPQALLGSPAYMAPEQIRSSKSVDQRADIWSVGVILYELLSGVSPFAGESVGETFGRVIDAAPEPLGAARGDLPAGLVAIVAKCLEGNKDKRFAHVGELAEALAPYASPRARELVGTIGRVLGVAPSRGELQVDRARRAGRIREWNGRDDGRDDGLGERGWADRFGVVGRDVRREAAAARVDGDRGHGHARLRRNGGVFHARPRARGAGGSPATAPSGRDTGLHGEFFQPNETRRRARPGAERARSLAERARGRAERAPCARTRPRWERGADDEEAGSSEHRKNQIPE